VAPNAPLLDPAGTAARELVLAADVFGAEVKPHLVHETVRAELAARRAGTHSAKSRGFVSGGRSKPWRQKGTGRARAGTTRAPQWTGGGVAFPPTPRSYEVKVNRQARRAALRAALSAHAAEGTLGLVDGTSFDVPSTRRASELIAGWDRGLPLLVVAQADEEGLIKSFRNLDRVGVTVPEELEVADVVWARTLLVTEAALPLVQSRAVAKRPVRGGNREVPATEVSR
jgi:large subunit ribosomal protein L4